MAETPSVKSQGMKFAEEQLHKHGWTEGKGLGKREHGISEAVKVKVKCDTAGVGHNSAEQFTFHWWDHVFNKTASSISVESDQDGVQVKKVAEGDSAVTNKKPRKALTNRDMLYGRFIKSATLLAGGEESMEKESSSDSSDSSEDEDEKLDLSSAIKLTDEDLVKICGGRTAHKGARHGLKMSAKLSRIEEQERAFLEKYGKKEPNKEPMRPVSGASLQKDTKNRQDITPEDISRKKKKKAAKYEENSEESRNSYEHEKDTILSKRTVDNKELVDSLSDDPSREKGVASSNKKSDEDTVRELEHCHFTERELKSSKKKKKVVSESNSEADPEDQARSTEPTIQSSKKKKRRLEEERDKVREEELNGHREWDPSEDPGVSRKKKKSRRGLKERVEEQEESTEEHAQSEMKQKKIKEDVSMEEEGSQSTKKKSKSRDCSTPDEEQLAVDSTEQRIKSKKKRKH